MPASLRQSRFDSSALRRDETSVSEVVGQILIFGILSMVLILSLIGFNAVKQGTEAGAIEARAGMVAQRTASLAVEAALFAEANPGIRYQGLLPFEYELEGHEYMVAFDDGSVVVMVPGILVQPVRAPLFAAQAPANVVVCSHPPVAGGPIFLSLRPGDDANLPVDCQGHAASTQVIFLQENP